MITFANLCPQTIPGVNCPVPTIPVFSCFTGNAAQGAQAPLPYHTWPHVCTIPGQTAYPGCGNTISPQAQAPGTMPGPSAPLIGCTGYLGCQPQHNTCGGGGYPTVAPQTLYCGPGANPQAIGTMPPPTASYNQCPILSAVPCPTVGYECGPGPVIPTNNMPICPPKTGYICHYDGTNTGGGVHAQNTIISAVSPICPPITNVWPFC